jgi:formylglycine-generating enzyme required for sulfatase activity
MMHLREQLTILILWLLLATIGNVCVLPAALIEEDPRARTDHMQRLRATWIGLEKLNFRALRLAIEDLTETFPEQYDQGKAYLRCLEVLERQLPSVIEALAPDNETALAHACDFLATARALHREALLANPLLDFDQLLLIKRKPLGDPRRPDAPDKGFGEFIGLPKQSSWQNETMPNVDDWENEIAVLAPVQSTGTLRSLFQPSARQLIADIELSFDADRILFSMPDDNQDWQIFEISGHGKEWRQLSPQNQPDIHNFDACYLPSGDIVFLSSACLQGVPCNDSVTVSMLYKMDGNGGNIRQLNFDQDHDYAPAVMNDGRILYLRWDYTDLPHNWTRILFTMNPDGTGQRQYYGSGSYWPSAIFYARPIPGHPTKVAGVVTGHHVGRVGELVIFDPKRGRHETDGVVQRIPGYGKKVLPLIEDQLTINSWPKFVHPYPLSENYFLVSCKPTPNDLWGIYLVDVFDNVLLLKEIERYGLFEPIPFKKRPRPPVIPQLTNPKDRESLMYVADVYAGPGLKGVPRDTVKELRLFSYHFAYQYNSGGQHRVGTDGPWEPKRVLGMVPVEEDGSALFRVPADTPISIQPVNAQGEALQLMRSWATAKGGEFVSCIGCHDNPNATPPSRKTIAASKAPTEIQPWYGPTRPFSFKREVQPVLDRHCVSCHNGQERDNDETIPDLRGEQGGLVVFGFNEPKPKYVRGIPREELIQEYAGVFDPSYIALRRLVRVGGLESDAHIQPPGEFHADTSELMQMLHKGHHGVKLDRESWERLAVWIDLNAPCYGTWREIIGPEKADPNHDRRLELRALYGGPLEDPEVYPDMPRKRVEPVQPGPCQSDLYIPVKYADWTFSAQEAGRLQRATGLTKRTIDLGEGVYLELVRVPAGVFVMGDAHGHEDERPLTRVNIPTSFWMGKLEITNQQYARFEPSHDSRFEHGPASSKDKEKRGPALNLPHQPVVRISWQEAVSFCRWLSLRIGTEVTLPTEAQWEYACRAGTAEAFSFGDLDTDFTTYANMADATMNRWATYSEKRRTADIVPRDTRFNDGTLATADVGSYKPNAWGLHDLHGNVWEWTRSSYLPYPYRKHDGRSTLLHVQTSGRKVVRGGSWYDRPKRCRSAFRLSYPAWRKVYNVGFRIIVQDPRKEKTLVKGF